MGSDIQSQLIKSVGQMVTKLKKGVSYTTFKAWVSALHDWLASHAQLTPEQLGPASLRAIIRLTIDNELYTVLE